MVEFCLGSYLVIAVFATVLVLSALVLGRRTDRIRYGIHFWSSLAQAKRDDHIRFEIYSLAEEDLPQPVNKKVRLPRTAPPIDI